MNTVIFSTPLQRFTQGRSSAEYPGETVDDVLRHADEQFPGLYASIVNNGMIVPFVHVSVNDSALGSADLTTQVDDKSQIRLIAAVAGG